ncbi:MAG: LysM peptidoglycan-binding domain-containing protein [Pseudomonadales bacterium]
MKRWILTIAAGFWLIASVAYAQVTLKDNHPESYVVKEGDTLWDISGKFLNEPWLWPEIWQVNPQVSNPHLIYPGDKLYLTYVDGKPRLSLTRGSGGVVKLSPGMRTSPVDNAIPAIPLDEIHAFLRNSRFIEPGEMDGAPYMVGGTKRHIISGVGDQVYARGYFDEENKVYGVYREGTLYKDPETGEALGMQATEIGETKMVSLQEDIATLDVNRSHEELRSGDKFLPLEVEPLRALFQPALPLQDIKGEILDVEGGVTQIGPMNVVMVNRGTRDGLEPGSVMSIWKRGETILDRVANQKLVLPDENAGLLMYFRVYEKMSYALVLETKQPLSVGDRVDMPRSRR